MADGMEDLKLTVNKDFAKKLYKQKEKAELDQCKYSTAFPVSSKNSNRGSRTSFSGVQSIFILATSEMFVTCFANNKPYNFCSFQ